MNNELQANIELTKLRIFVKQLINNHPDKDAAVWLDNIRPSNKVLLDFTPVSELQLVYAIIEQYFNQAPDTLIKDLNTTIL